MEVLMINDNVLIRRTEEMKTSKSGLIIIPDTCTEKPMTGTVVAVGDGILKDNGVRIPLGIQIDDLVVFSKYSGTDFVLNDTNYLIIKERDILAVLRDEKETKDAA
jgi:chaperonin GroES